MKILAIETSCDETAIAILSCNGDEQHSEFKILGNALLSQIEIHKPYGGVFPALAKREHAKNLVPILESALEEAELLREDTQALPEETRAKIAAILAREPGLAEAFLEFISECEPPAIDAIAVTAGPGLEPALWVGISFAKALALVWNKPLVAVNHMEGHIMAALTKETQDAQVQGDSSQRGVSLRLLRENGEQFSISNLQFPILALLISGGHTELVVMKKWLEYEMVGQTRDDAVGEAFDKVARMLGLPYPGGPEISRLAELIRDESRGASSSDEDAPRVVLPRPMIHENSCDFSFAGLKTAVLNLLKKIPDISDDDKRHVAHEFENAVTEVLWKKTARAIEQTDAQMLVIGGGVSANTHIKRTFRDNIAHEFSDVAICIPEASLSTDNAIMIALAGYYRALREEFKTDFSANGNLPLI